MQTDIYCIWEKQWCTFFSPQNHFATLCSTVVWDRSLLRSCPSRGPRPSFQLWVSSFPHRIICSSFFPFPSRSASFPRAGMLLSHSGKILTWPSSGASQSIQKKSTRETLQGTYPKVGPATCYGLNLSDTKLDFCSFLLFFLLQFSKQFKKEKKSNIEYINPYCKPQH